MNLSDFASVEGVGIVLGAVLVLATLGLLTALWTRLGFEDAPLSVESPSSPPL